VSPIYKFSIRLKKNKKLRAGFYAGTALLLAGVFIIVALLSANSAATDTALTAKSQSPTLSDKAPETSLHETLQRIALAKHNAESTPGSYTTEMTPVPTPIATTPPEPSMTPVPTTKPEPSPKATPKPTPKPTKAPDLNALSQYFMVEADKYYNNIGYSSNSYDYTEEDVMMLARVITREAGGESYQGMLAVGNVVMNRVFCGYWGKTIASVVTAPGQFAYSPARTPKQKCIEAARDVLKNERWVIPQNVYFFNSGRKAGENWGKYKYYTKIGGHCFYTHTIGRRYNGSGIPPALYERVYKWPQYGCKREKRVTRLQQMLVKLGYKTDTNGYFGKTTREAVIKFQKDKGLKADGLSGPTTIKALIKAYGVDAYRKKYKA
jgi:spore germination cell wall hydrolase CwlJ-like protein